MIDSMINHHDNHDQWLMIGESIMITIINNHDWFTTPEPRFWGLLRLPVANSRVRHERYCGDGLKGIETWGFHGKNKMTTDDKWINMENDEKNDDKYG